MDAPEPTTGAAAAPSSSSTIDANTDTDADAVAARVAEAVGVAKVAAQAADAAAAAAEDVKEVAPAPTPDPVCWICYESHAGGDGSDATVSRLVAPCKCSGSLRTAHQECLLAWMEQTNATVCPHCQHTYAVDDQYPSTLQRLGDHPWVPMVVAAVVCGALFYAFHRLWVWFTTKRRAQSASSGSRLLGMGMMGGGGGATSLLSLMMPQMGGLLNAGGVTLLGPPATASGSRWGLTQLLAEVEVFALVTMVAYGCARYVHGKCRGEEAASEEADDNVTALDLGACDAGLDDLWATIDDVWAASASGSRQLSHDEALYTLPFDILATLFRVVERYTKRAQTWAVAKERVVLDYDATGQNNMGVG